jgi:hypothetical protein
MPDDPTVDRVNGAVAIQRTKAEPANGARHSVARGRGVQDRADSVMTGRANRPLVVTGP